MTEADLWIRQAAARCQDCVSSKDICIQAQKLTIHMYLSHLDKDNWQANLLSVKAFLLTQNLDKTQLWIWTESIGSIVNNDTQRFFSTFADVVCVKQLAW